MAGLVPTRGGARTGRGTGGLRADLAGYLAMLQEGRNRYESRTFEARRAPAALPSRAPSRSVDTGSKRWAVTPASDGWDRGDDRGPSLEALGRSEDRIPARRGDGDGHRHGDDDGAGRRPAGSLPALPAPVRRTAVVRPPAGPEPARPATAKRSPSRPAAKTSRPGDPQVRPHR